MLAETELTEVAVLVGAAAGEPLAVRALIERFGPTVYGFVYARVGGHPEIAEDLVQETFIEAVRSAKTFRGESSLRTWLCAIARRRVGRHYEAERRKALAWSGSVEVAGLDAKDDNIAVDRRDEVTRALSELPPLYRQVLVLKYMDELSVQQIAGHLGCSRVQVQSLLQRARVRLREELSGPDG